MDTHSPLTQRPGGEPAIVRGVCARLAKANRLVLLRDLFVEIVVPSTVVYELRAKNSVESQAIEKALESWLRPMEHNNEQAVAEATFLGLGERQAIGLAIARSDRVLLDDRKAREFAKSKGVKVLGTMGVLILAKEARLILSVREVAEGMMRHGYWISPDLFRRALILAKE